MPPPSWGGKYKNQRWGDAREVNGLFGADGSDASEQNTRKLALRTGARLRQQLLDVPARSARRHAEARRYFAQWCAAGEQPGDSGFGSRQLEEGLQHLLARFDVSTRIRYENHDTQWSLAPLARIAPDERGEQRLQGRSGAAGRDDRNHRTGRAALTRRAKQRCDDGSEPPRLNALFVVGADDDQRPICACGQQMHRFVRMKDKAGGIGDERANLQTVQ
jgi:hypothetical protein